MVSQPVSLRRKFLFGWHGLAVFLCLRNRPYLVETNSEGMPMQQM
jgi:hypothetical protein